MESLKQLIGLLFFIAAFTIIDSCETSRIFFGSFAEQHPDLVATNGVYTQLRNDPEGFPVFKHENGEFYIYHINNGILAGDQVGYVSSYWVIGHRVGSTDALVSARSSVIHPAEVGLQWRVRSSTDAVTWVRKMRLNVVCASDDFGGVCSSGLVRLRGLHHAYGVQARRLGVYRITEQTNDLRPVYKHVAENQFLFYCATTGLWIVGPRVGQMHGGLFVPDNAWRPELITHHWVVMNGYLMDNDPGLKVECESDSIDADRSSEDSRELEEGSGSATSSSSDNEAQCDAGYCLNGGMCYLSSSHPGQGHGVAKGRRDSSRPGRGGRGGRGGKGHPHQVERQCICLIGFTGPRCDTAIRCGPIPSSRFMSVVQSSGSSFLDVVFLSCHASGGNVGLVTSAVCQADGRWSRLPNCR